MKTNDIIRPLTTADTEYSVCGYSVLRKAKVVEVLPRRKENGNNIKIEILEHTDGNKVGKKYTVDDRYFEVIPQEWIWVDGYKATDANGCCNGYQYDTDGETNVYCGNLALGAKGFHFCRELKHTFKEYPYNATNLYWAVRALVKASDYNNLNPNNTTLVAKEIEFVYKITNHDYLLNAYGKYIEDVRSRINN